MENGSAPAAGAFNSEYQHPLEELQAISDQSGLKLKDQKFAQLMDEKDPLRHLRNEFHYPTMSQILNSKFVVDYKIVFSLNCLLTEVTERDMLEFVKQCYLLESRKSLWLDKCLTKHKAWFVLINHVWEKLTVTVR